MINPGKSLGIGDLKEVLSRRVWYIVIPFVVIVAGTLGYVLHAPKEYRATTLILVTPQKVPEQFVMSTVTAKIEERLHSIAQEIISRTRLEQVITEFKLYPEKKGTISQEEIVELMRKNIEIEIPKKDKEKSSFTVSYVGKDPKAVAMVTNKLASLFIEENLKLREQQAQGTSEFLSVELNATKTTLEEQERAVTQFKRQHMGELPEQREANLRVFEQLQNLYQRANESLRSAQDRRVVIQKQLADIDLMIASLSNRNEAGPRGSTEETSLQALSLLSQPRTGARERDFREVQLEQLKTLLVELQGKYTEKHPDIQTTKKKISELERQNEKMRLEKETDLSPSVRVSPLPRQESRDEMTEKQEILRFSLRRKEMESQLVATDLEIERMKEEEAKVKAQMVKYRDRIENTPIREQAMTTLARDYQNTRDSYQSLLKKSQEAQQAENLERRQKGEQFKVIDPARVPEKPFKPDIPKILLIGLVLALGGGAGTAFAREQMDRSFRDADDVEATLGLRVLANVPKIKEQPVAQTG